MEIVKMPESDESVEFRRMRAGECFIDVDADCDPYVYMVMDVEGEHDNAVELETGIPMSFKDNMRFIRVTAKLQYTVRGRNF